MPPRSLAGPLWFDRAHSRMEPLIERWKSSVVLADGAMGTLLFGRAAVTTCVELFNLNAPELVEAAHREYLDAGATLVETNTFAANRLKLAPHELADKLLDINRSGVEIARRASQGRAYVAASVGPLGALLRPLGGVDPGEASDVFHEHIRAVADAQPDLLLLETFGDLEEALIALRAATSVTRSIPVLVSMSVLEDGRTPAGDELATAFAALREHGADAVGVNCAVGPQGVYDALARVLADVDCPVSAMPNAGYPHRVDDRTVYESAPSYFARFARQFVALGVTIVGGCCGTTPEHIAAMAPEVVGAPARRRRQTIPVKRSDVAPRSVIARPRRRGPTTFEEQLGRRFVTTVEMLPPRNADPEPLLAAARLLHAAGVDAVHIPDAAGARPAMSGASAAALVMRETGLAAVLHVSCRDRNLVGLQSELLGAAALGIPAIVALTGDPLNVGDFPRATSVFDVTALGLTRILRALNEGKDHAGADLGAATHFRIGAAVNPLARDVPAECARLQEKIDAGADFAVTQPVFSVSALQPFLERSRMADIPILVGLLPLRSLAQAEFLHNEVPGMQIPQTVRDRLRSADDEEREGIAIAASLMLEFARTPGIAGAYIMAHERYDVAAELVGGFAHARAARA